MMRVGPFRDQGRAVGVLKVTKLKEKMIFLIYEKQRKIKTFSQTNSKG